MLITTTQALADFCAALADAPYIAVDTEFMRERTYYAQLCLVQVAYGDHAAAIDPLAPDLDLAPLKDLLLNPNIMKVLHAATQDLEIFLQKTGAVPSPVFDTQIAATVCDLGEQPGYARVVSGLLSIQLDKSSQATDWSLRPLSDRQLVYALGDVTHLCRVYEILVDKLDKAGRTAWVAEDMAELLRPGKYRVEPEDAFKRVKIRRAKRRTLAVLQKLAAWRETQAMSRDLPRGWLVKDEALIEIAQHLPEDAASLARVRKLPSAVAKGPDGQALMDAVQAGLAVPDDDCPPLPPKKKPISGHENLVALLQALLRVRCEEKGVAMRMIATRDDLDLLATQDEPKVACLRGWRHTVFGKDALALKAGRLALTGHGNGVEVFEVDED